MAAYLIVNIVVRDVEKYKPYVLAAPGIIRRFGGRYLVRGGASEILEGTPQINRTVVIEFPSKQSIVDFYNDPEYQALAPIRQQSTDTQMFWIEGYEPAAAG